MARIDRIKRQNTVLRVAIRRLLAVVDDRYTAVDCAEQALAAKSDEDMDDFFEDWPDDEDD